MKNLICLLLLLVTPFLGWSQHSSGGGFALTAYANILLEDKEVDIFNLVNGQTQEMAETSKQLRVGRFSPALFVFHSGGHFSEIELSFLSFKKQDFTRITELSDPFPGTTRSFPLGIRYAFNFNLLSRQDAAVQPCIGLSALPFLERTSTKPEMKTIYTTTQTDLGILGQIIPRLIIHLTDFMILDLNAPVTILDARSHTLKLQGGEGGLATITEKKGELRWLPSAVHIRVGVGVVF